MLARKMAVSEKYEGTNIKSADTELDFWLSVYFVLWWKEWEHKITFAKSNVNNNFYDEIPNIYI